MTAPCVSVLIPTLDRADLLAEALESVLVQRGVDLEVVVSDNASCDDTPARVAEAADPRVRLIRQHRRVAQVQNWGAALAAARAPFALFLADDERLADPGVLERRLTALHGAPEAAVAFSGLTTMTPDGELLRFAPELPDGAVISGPDLVRLVLRRRLPICAALYRTEVLRSCWPAAERHPFCLDLALNLDLAVRGRGPALYVADDGLSVRQHAAQFGTIHRDEVLREMERIPQAFLRECPDPLVAGLLRQEAVDARVTRAGETARAGRRGEALRLLAGVLLRRPAHAYGWRQVARVASGRLG